MKSNDEWVELNVAGDRLRKVLDKEVKEEIKK